MKPRYCAPTNAPVSRALDGLARPAAPVPAPRMLLYFRGGFVPGMVPEVTELPEPLSSTKRPFAAPMPTMACGGIDSPGDGLPGSLIVSCPGTLVTLPKSVGPQIPVAGEAAGWAGAPVPPAEGKVN